MNSTQDLSKFGYREKDIAADLLKAYASGQGEFLSDGVTVEFNPNSGNVFLVDEDYNVGMMNGDKLEQFFSCSDCGAEGFKGDFEDDESHTFDGAVSFDYIEHIEKVEV